MPTPTPVRVEDRAVATAPPAARRVVLATVALLPLGNVVVPGVGTPFATVLLLVGAMACAAVLLAHQRLSVPRSAVLGASAALVVSGLISTLAAGDYPASLIVDAVALVGLAAATAVVITHRSVEHLRTLAGMLVLAAAVVAAWSLRGLGSVSAEFGGAVIEGRLSSPLTEPNELGAVMAWSLPLALTMALTATTRLPRLVFALASGLITGALAFSFSRGSWLGFGAGLLALWVMSPALRRRLNRIALAGFVAVALLATRLSEGLWGALTARVRSGSELSANPYDERPAIWQEALRQISDRPLLGNGPYGYALTARTGQSELGTTSPEHAHSLYLTVTAEQGLLGLCLLAVLVGCCVNAVRRTASRRGSATPARPLVAGAAAGLVALAVQGIVDYPLRNAMVSALAWLLLGILAAGARVSGSSPPPAPARAGGRTQRPPVGS